MLGRSILLSISEKVHLRDVAVSKCACCDAAVALGFKKGAIGDGMQESEYTANVGTWKRTDLASGKEESALFAKTQQLTRRFRAISKIEDSVGKEREKLEFIPAWKRQLVGFLLLLPLAFLVWIAKTRFVHPTGCWIHPGSVSITVGSVLVSVFVLGGVRLNWQLRGKVIRSRCLKCENVSHSRKQEENLMAQRAHRAKQQFMAYVFHNIRVPFNAIVLGLGHMRASASGDDTSSGDMLDLVQLMLDCAETMTNVLDDVTDMGNWEEGRIELNRDVFDLLAVVKFLAWGLKDLLEQKQISLNIDIDPVASTILESHNIVGDKHRTVQTLGNFLSNAVKFTPNGGKLDLEIKCEELDSSSIATFSNMHVSEEHKSIKLFIAVNDTGAGMSLDDREKLFEADSFISSSWIQKAGVSSCLGLSVAKRFIEQIGGQIGVQSREEGSTFFFSAPFALVPIQKRGNCSFAASHAFYNGCTKDKQQELCGKVPTVFSAVELPSQAVPRRRKVLLVEDTRINRIILRKVLQNLNLQCDEAENGQIAVDLHKQGKSYDLVLMDKEMPVMDGHEATRTLRMMGVKTPIVALTGNALQSDKELFFEAGVNEFQTKPLSRDKLIQLLARYGVESSSAL